MRHWRLAFAAGVAAVATVVLAGVAFAAMRESDPDGSVSSPPMTPGPPVIPADSYAGLAEARRDLARRVLGGDSPTRTLRVQLSEVRHAGWDGCLGVVRPDQACTAILTGGLVALFHLDGKQYRYHVAGGQVIATDFLPGPVTVTDGTPPDPFVRMDAVAMLVQYALADLAMQSGVEPREVTTTSIVPREARLSPDDDAEPTDEAVATFRLPGGEARAHHVDLSGVDALAEVPPAGEVAALQQRMREDLAGRLNVALDEVSVLSYRDVLWPDGCIGIHAPGRVCTAVITPGFVAILSAPVTGATKTYRYHGAGSEFTAVSFLQGVTVDMP